MSCAITAAGARRSISSHRDDEARGRVAREHPVNTAAPWAEARRRTGAELLDLTADTHGVDLVARELRPHLDRATRAAIRRGHARGVALERSIVPARDRDGIARQRRAHTLERDGQLDAFELGRCDPFAQAI